jgi:hypothetical protein
MKNKLTSMNENNSSKKETRKSYILFLIFFSLGLGCIGIFTEFFSMFIEIFIHLIGLDIDIDSPIVIKNKDENENIMEAKPLVMDNKVNKAEIG